MTDTDLEEIRRRRRDRNRLGLRQWIVVFLTVCAGDQAGVAAHAWIIPVVGALISFLGVPAGLIGNTAMLPYITVLGLSVIAGFIVQGNFSNLTSGSSQSRLPSTAGRRSGCIPASALAPHSLGALLFGVTLDQFGGISQLAAWIVSFGTCGLACLAGAAATMFLPRDDTSPKRVDQGVGSESPLSPARNSSRFH